MLDGGRGPKNGDYFAEDATMVTQSMIAKIAYYKQNIPDATCWPFETPNKTTEHKIFQN